jgi:hypothetical protein
MAFSREKLKFDESTDEEAHIWSSEEEEGADSREVMQPKKKLKQQRSVDTIAADYAEDEVANIYYTKRTILNA